jgi:galactokinase
MEQEPVALSTFVDPERVESALSGGGLSKSRARELSRSVTRAATHLAGTTSGDTPARAFFVPGRVEILGKHTDYAGGSSLTCATQSGITVVSTARADQTITLRDCDRGETAEILFDERATARPGHWSNYGISVVRRMARDFPENHLGADLAFSSNLPVASGMSSSSALTVSIFLALSATTGIEEQSEYVQHYRRRTALAEYLGAVESGRPHRQSDADDGVGTSGGNEDHVAILCSDRGLLKWYSYLPVRLRGGVAFPEGHVLAVAYSGVQAQKTGSARDLYNAVSARAVAIAEIWRAETGRSEAHLGAIASIPGYSRTEVTLALLNQEHHRFSQGDLIDRLYQFHYEDHVILPRAFDALQEGDLHTFGEQVEHSQMLAESKLRNQVDETIELVRQARSLGSPAASSFGGGFGGSVWALVSESSADEFVNRWSGSYAESFPHRANEARFFTDRPGPAAFELRP